MIYIYIYIGFDSSNYGHKLAYKVCKKSILKYNNKVNIIPLIKKDLEEKKRFLIEKTIMVQPILHILDF